MAKVTIVGAGILGLAHAYHAARRGHAVTVIERQPKASGASTRNFGMVWPIGQPPGELLTTALRSAEIWREVLAAAHLPYSPTGSLHVVYRDDEADVAREFAELAPANGYRAQWLEPAAVLEKTPAVRPQQLLGGLWSDTEITVDPRLTIAQLPALFAEEFGVRFEWQTTAVAVDGGTVRTSRGAHDGDCTIVCGGDDFETLYPQLFDSSGVTRCKLQMLRTGPQPGGWQLGPALAAGLTLRFYPAFRVCSTLAALERRIEDETPELNRWGIHVLVSQTAQGELTLGDSHEYGRAVDIFDKEEIDRLILEYLDGFLVAPSREIEQRWHGIYAKHPSKPFLREAPESNVRIVTATGGSGMTLSFGLAEQTIEQLGL